MEETSQESPKFLQPHWALVSSAPCFFFVNHLKLVNLIPGMKQAQWCHVNILSFLPGISQIIQFFSHGNATGKLFFTR